MIAKYEDLESTRHAASTSVVPRAALATEKTNEQDVDQALPGADAPLRILSLSVTAADGGPIYSGNPAQINVLCEASEQIDSVLCGFEIGIDDIFPAAVLENEIDTLKPGLNKLVCSVEHLPFLPGTHRIAISFVEKQNGAVFGPTKAMLTLRILLRSRADRTYWRTWLVFANALSI